MLTSTKKSIFDYQLYLFDLDGTIINSEPVHYHCYMTAAKEVLPPDQAPDWDFAKYCQFAHAIAIPDLPWIFGEHYQQIYQRKEQLFAQQIMINPTYLPGFSQFLSRLLELQKKIAVVTHSRQERIAHILKAFPLLRHIIHWVTRDQVQHPKPSSESYMKAIQKYPITLNEIVGFEDSYKGYQSLSGIREITKIYINQPNYYWDSKINCPYQIQSYDQLSEITFQEY